MKYCYLLILIALLESCSTKECTSYSGSLRADTAFVFNSPLPTQSKTYQFGIHLYTYNNQAYLLSLDGQKNIILNSLADSRKTVFPTGFSQQTQQVLPSKLVHDSLFIQDFDSHELYIFKITPDSLRKLKKINYRQLFVNWQQYGLDPQYYEPFEVFNNTIHLPYRINEAATNFNDSTSYITFPLADTVVSSHKVIRLLPTAPDYRKETVRNTYTFLKQLDDSLCMVAFGFIDSIFLYNYRTGDLVKKITFNNCSQFRKFKSKQVDDLAYVRWYDATTEENVKVLANKDRVLIIKRLRRDEINDPSKYEYYYFDKDLNLLKHHSFKHSIRDEYCFVYKDGFLLFDEKLAKAYYYVAQ